MKRKYADRIDWRRVVSRNFKCVYMEEQVFKGYVTLLSLHQVEKRLFVQYQDEELCIAADGYFWLQQFPVNSNFCVTTMLNQNHEVVQWYIDISRTNGISDEGIPYWDDVYLDVIVLPDGNFFIKDEDELEEALRQGHIERQDYRLAKETAEKIKLEIRSGENMVINNSIRHFQQLINL
ncbi:DUF402 domain-containing protein [Paenibacillus sp. EZ-K15]|uniref:DUF402 domain-containing protein n=1 Tax=Paenibacillus sp. EZ-K15 TaxID=2044275 RepID=UPI00137ABBAC|nr:DUF402 domain-containing protein [Paenibacillus sp. EZ-K15]